MAGYVELIIDQGSTYNNVIDLTDNNGSPINLDSYMVSGQIRKWYTSANASATFSVAIIDAANGTIEMTLTSANTANIKSGRHVFDLFMKSNTTNEVTRVIEGIVTITPRATTDVLW